MQNNIYYCSIVSVTKINKHTVKTLAKTLSTQNAVESVCVSYFRGMNNSAALCGARQKRPCHNAEIENHIVRL